MEKTKGKLLKKVLFPLLLVAAVFAVVFVAKAYTWITQTVDSGEVGLFSSMDVDNSVNKYPHIAYYDQTDDDLEYAAWNGSSWSTETVDSSDNVGSYVSLKLDSSNNPHISYYDASNGDLKYATKSGGSWSIETVASMDDVGSHTSIDLDSSGNPHISYFDNTNQALKYATKSGGFWINETIHDDDTKSVGLYTSIALDSSDKAHVSYYNATDGDLMYAKRVGSGGSGCSDGAWDGCGAVINDNDVGKYTSIVVDSSDAPHISYYDATNGDLYYIWKDIEAGKWYDPHPVAADGDVGKWNSMKIDSSNIRHFSHFDATNRKLLYSQWSGSGKQPAPEVVDDMLVAAKLPVDASTSLALDFSEKPTISYFDASLEYAKTGAEGVAIPEFPSKWIAVLVGAVALIAAVGIAAWRKGKTVK